MIKLPALIEELEALIRERDPWELEARINLTLMNNDTYIFIE